MIIPFETRRNTSTTSHAESPDQHVASPNTAVPRNPRISDERLRLSFAFWHAAADADSKAGCPDILRGGAAQGLQLQVQDQGEDGNEEDHLTLEAPRGLPKESLEAFSNVGQARHCHQELGTQNHKPEEVPGTSAGPGRWQLESKGRASLAIRSRMGALGRSSQWAGRFSGSLGAAKKP